ncbi:MAG: Ig-like domain-containing protein [Syntrophales bacterium]|nr:Ig-like domain-containing protein [Syntrophales bacterium]
MSNSNWTIHNNNLYGNTSYDLSYSGGSGTTLDATDNWWGTTNAVEISAHVYDSNDDLTKGTINLGSVLMSAGGTSNNVPSISANVSPFFGNIPFTPTFTGSGTDSDGSIAKYEWDFDGDGTFDWNSTNTGNSTHTYSTSGNYTATFRITDNLGITNQVSIGVTAIDPNSPTAIPIGGKLISDLTLLQGFTFVMHDNLIVPSGLTLTIESGVTIKIDSGKAIQVDGTLISRGTSENKVVFTSSLASPVAGSWGFIKFTDSSIDATFDDSGNYTGGSILQHCKIEYAGGGSVPDAVIVESAAPFIDNCEIAYTKGAGIYATNPPNIRITNNNIHHSQKIGNGYSITGGGIAIDGGSAIIKGNVLSNNAGEQRGGGITLRSISASTLVDGNTITNNTGNGNDSGAGGIHVGGNSAVITISNNTVDSNSGSSGYGGGAGGIKVHYNTANVVIDSNTVINNTGDCGINLGGGGFGPSAHATIQNNAIKNNASSGIQVFGDGQPTVISGNTIQSNTGNGVNIVQGQNITIQNNTVESNNGGISVGSGSGQTISGNTIRNNAGSGLSLGSGSGSVSTNTITGNSSSGISVSNSNWTIHNNNLYGNTSYDLSYSGGSGTTLDTTDNWWGTINASDIDMDVYDKYDDLVKGISNFSTLLPYAGAVILGPTNPFISILKRSGTVKNPVLTLSLGADGPPIDMKITEDPEFPPPASWETFAATKEFKGDGTKYIYAKYRDASTNESAIAFARPRGVLYIQKNKTLVSRPVNIKIRAAEVYTKKYPDLIAKLYFRGIGETVFQQTVMDLVDNVHQAWIPAEHTVNGIEYYIMVEDGQGNVLTSLPESNPSTQPMSMSSDQLVTESLEKGKDVELELAMGVTLKLPASAVVSDTNLVVRKPESELAALPGITPMGIGFDVSLENGTKAFTEPVQMAIGYNHKEISDASQRRLRVYYRRDDGLIRLVQGFVDLLTKEFKFSTNHFSSFFLAEGSDAYPELPISWTQGQPLVVKISVLKGVPLSQATLYYRSGEKNDWTALTMTKSGDFLEATIPGNEVVKSGLSYYVEGTDGETSATSGTVAVYTGEDNYEIDDSDAKASVIVLNHDYPQIHNFHATGDEDWAKFYAHAGIVYEIKASNLGQYADVVLDLYDTDGETLLTSVDDGFNGQDELLSWTAPEKGIYYVRVRQYDAAVFGAETNYDLRIYRPVAPDIGTIRGIILSDTAQARISGAAILASLGSAISSNGDFILKVEAGTVSVQAEANGYQSATIPNVQVQAGQETVVDISMLPLTAALTVAKTGNGLGTVTSNPAGINCGVDCTETYNSGTAVTLTASPDSGFTFAGWSGACSGTASACDVAMDADKSVSAAFADISPPVGSVSMSGGAVLANNGTVTIAISATDAGSVVQMRFSNDGVTWSDAEAYATVGTWTLASGDGSKTLYAKFKDSAGNWSQAYTYLITLDTVAPVLTLSTLPDGAYINNPTLNVAGSVTDATSGGKTLTVNGKDATIGVDGIFSDIVTLVAGANALTVTATDNAGNQTTATRTITLDQTAPALMITAPADNSKTGVSDVTVTGNVDETSTVEITLNGDVAQATTMSGNNFNLSLTLTYGVNTIDVKVTDRAGNNSSGKRTVTYDNQGPSLAITVPAQDVRTNQGSIIIKGTVTDLTTVSLTLTDGTNTFSPVVTAGAFEQAITLAVEKTYAVTVTAADAVGNQTIVQRNVIYDITPPAMAVNALVALTNKSSQTVTGSRETNAIITVTCSTATIGTVTYPTDTSWSVTISSLTGGNNAIVFKAADAAGNETALDRSITLDTTPPVAEISGLPGSPTKLTGVTLNIAGAGVTAYRFKVDNSSYSQEVAVTDPIILTAMSEGSHTVYVVGRDAAWNWQVEELATSVTWVVDTIAPLVEGTVNDGSPYAMKNTAILTFTPSTADVVKLRLSNDGAIWGEEQAYASSLTWNLGTSDGAKTIYVKFKDSAGNWSHTHSYTVNLDTMAPVLALSTMSDGSYTNNPTLNVAGSVTDATSGMKTLTVNVKEATIGVDGTFSDIVTLVAGENTLTVIATDNAGNQTTETRTITLDQTAPVLTITAPADNSKTGVSDVTVTGSVDETSTVEITLNGGAAQSATMSGKNFNLPLTLTYGVNTIDIAVTDRAGNEGAGKRTVTYDNQGPSLAITVPAQDVRTNQGSIIIKGTVTDLTTVSLTLTDGTNTFSPAVTAGAFEQAITLAVEKTYAVTVTAADAVGNQTIVQRNIIYDITPPEMTIDAFATLTNQLSRTLTGTKEANTTLTITCPTATVGAITYPTNTSWSVTISSLIEGNNAIVFKAVDAVGNETALDRSITLDTTPPVAEISGLPGSPTKLTGATLNIAGADVTAYRYKLDNGGYSQETAATDPITLTALSDGSHTVYVIGRDAVGNWQAEISATKATWVVDTAAPLVEGTVNDGSPYAMKNTATLAFIPSTLDIVKIHLSNDGAIWGEEQAYANNLTWNLGTGDGVRTLYVQFKDSAGNWSRTYTYLVTLDTVAPVLTVSTLSNGSYTNNPTLNVAGSVTDATSGVKTLTVNGKNATIGVNGAFSDAVILVTGANTITATATDNAGNQTTETRTITFDQTAPVLTITAPADNCKTGVSDVTVTGNVDETSTVEITLNGGVAQAATMSGNNFNLSLTLTYGANTIDIAVTDRSGNKGAGKRTVTYDNQGPSLAITVPAQDIRTNQGSIIIKGTVTDLTTVSLTLTDGTNTFSPAVTAGAFEQAITLTVEKTYGVTVTAADAIGNQTIVQRNIIYDITPPEMSVDAFATLTNKSSQTLTGTRETNTVVTVTCPTATIGTVTYSTDTSWSVTISSLTEGNNAIVFRAIDAAGNETALEKTIMLDTTPPVAEISGLPGSPTMLTGATLNIAGTGVTTYRYKVDNGSYSQEAATSNPISLATLSDGSHTVYVIGKDAAGNWQAEGLATAVTWVVDTAAPLVEGTVNDGSSYASNNMAILTFTTSAQDIVKLRLSNDGAIWGEEQAYASSLTWDLGTGAGSRTLYIQFRDSAGNWSQTHTYAVTLDTAAPVLTVSTLSDGSYTNNPTLNVAGSVTDATSGMKTLTVNGKDATIDVNGTFSDAVILVTGANAITVTATDNAGNQTTETRTITLDQTAPALTITAPTDNSKTGVSDVTVTGSVDETSTVEITLNGGVAQAATMSGNNFNLSLTLTYGVNTIDIAVTDRVGNKGAGKRSVTYDNQGPSLAITVPAQDIRTNQGSMIIKGTVVDLTAVALTLTDGTNTFSPAVTAGAFEQAITLAVEKTYAVIATAADTVGNQTIVQRNIIYDITPPVAEISGLPGSPTKLTGAILNIAGAGVTAYRYKLDNGGYSQEAAATDPIILTAISEGSHTVYVIGRDAAGNWQAEISATTATWVVDTAAPLIEGIVNDGSSYTNNNIAILTFATSAQDIVKLRLSNDGAIWGEEQAYSSSLPWDLGTGAGLRTLYIQFKDSAGNWSQTYTYAVTLDTVAPVLTLSMLSDGAYTNNPTLNVAGIVTDVTSGVKTLTVNGKDATIGVNGAFSDTVTLVAGANALTVTATDNAGNQTTETRTITLDQTAPVFSLNPVQSPTSQTDQTLTGTREASAKVAVVCPTASVGTVTYPTETTWSVTTTNLAEGDNAISVKANDIVGNEATIHSVITLFIVTSGDVNNDKNVDLIDAVLAIQVMNNMALAQPIYNEADVNGDHRIGMAEVLYILQKAAEMRQQ